MRDGSSLALATPILVGGFLAASDLYALVARVTIIVTNGELKTMLLATLLFSLTSLKSLLHMISLKSLLLVVLSGTMELTSKLGVLETSLLVLL
ncbi:hypothetical protein CLOP_g19476 [Closterium sp. NIES-67]|nr:hypothetical protein CLOP_g19476 [Closterium sp. NIES-67]